MKRVSLLMLLSNKSSLPSSASPSDVETLLIRSDTLRSRSAIRLSDDFEPANLNSSSARTFVPVISSSEPCLLYLYFFVREMISDALRI